MEVSLFDMMRPMALFSGLGAACTAASARGVGVLGYASVITGGLVLGIAAFWISQKVARRVSLRPPAELNLWMLYVGAFLGIAIASYAGGLGLLVLGTAI